MDVGGIKMRIGLVDVDKSKHYPNYALMKISAWHKQQGDEVEFAFSLATDYYDRIYKSKIFNYTEDDKTPYMCEVVRGGTGYSIDSKLPQHIDDMEPDYSLYPYIDDNTAYGFITRGCPNRCKWCVVPLKEGNVSPYRDVEQIAINGRKKLILMDNNILASDFGIGWDQTNWKDIWYWGDRLNEVKSRGMDHAGLLSLSGGKPFCLIAGQADNEESGVIMRRAKGYEKNPESLKLINHATGHRPPRSVTEEGYRFLDRYLKNF
jgi:hypothetical protein